MYLKQPTSWRFNLLKHEKKLPSLSTCRRVIQAEQAKEWSNMIKMSKVNPRRSTIPKAEDRRRSTISKVDYRRRLTSPKANHLQEDQQAWNLKFICLEKASKDQTLEIILIILINTNTNFKFYKLSLYENLVWTTTKHIYVFIFFFNNQNIYSYQTTNKNGIKQIISNELMITNLERCSI